MKLVRVLILVGAATLLNACTVLGFATDMALFSASEKINCKNNNHSSCRANRGTELTFHR